MIPPSVWLAEKCRDWFLVEPPATIHWARRNITVDVEGVRIQKPATEYKMRVIPFGKEDRAEPTEL